MLTRKDWQINPAVPDQGTIIDRVLNARGVCSAEDRQHFLHGTLVDLHDPFLLPDMAAACALLTRARENREMVLVHGDYDVDGLTATALVMQVLQQLDLSCRSFIPDRVQDGYGLSEDKIDEMIASGCKILLTVDCGISSREAIAEISRAGIDVIVTDHHECPSDLPEAAAVINPKRPDSNYPFAELAGVGVACKLMQAFCCHLDVPPVWQEYLDLVALGTVADVVPLLDENRLLVKTGLARINQNPGRGIAALLQELKLQNRLVTSHTLGFVVAPRINAAGRMADAGLALDLLQSADQAEARRLAVMLNEMNLQRQQVEARLVREARDEIEQSPGWAAKSILVVARDDWHPGVLGIAAARLAEYYCRPVIVLSGDDEGWQGSGRSWGSFDLLAALHQVSHYLTQYGGHRKAAGLRLSKENLIAFAAAVSQAGSTSCSPEQLRPVLIADLVLSADQISEILARQLLDLAPFGEKNPQPLWLTCRLNLISLQPAGNGRHLKLELEDPDSRQHFAAIAFGLGEADDLFRPLDQVDILYAIEINEWQGRQRLQLNIKDIRPSQTGEVFADRPWDVDEHYRREPDLDKIARQYQVPLHDLVPAAGEYKAVYQYLRATFARQPVLLDLSLLARRISRSYSLKLNMFRLSRILAVFEETGLIQLEHFGSDRVRLVLCPVSRRVKLETSPSYQQLQLKGSE